MSGIVTKKGHDYRGVLERAVGKNPFHPLNQGIHMEAHHLVSEEGIKPFKAFLRDKGYNINVKENLVFLPCTLPGACHLQVQLHRGNHTAKALEQEDDSDDKHPPSYHFHVYTMVNAKMDNIKNCTGDCDRVAELTQMIMNKVSKTMLADIRDYRIPLTDIFKSFEEDNEIGCGNCVDVEQYKKEAGACTSKRNHFNEDVSKFINGKFPKKITRHKAGVYKLEVGQ